jgi:hypothetical protein
MYNTLEPIYMFNFDSSKKPKKTFDFCNYLPFQDGVCVLQWCCGRPSCSGCQNGPALFGCQTKKKTRQISLFTYDCYDFPEFLSSLKSNVDI